LDEQGSPFPLSRNPIQPTVIVMARKSFDSSVGEMKSRSWSGCG
jgi:hypothetical protein